MGPWDGRTAEAVRYPPLIRMGQAFSGGRC